MVVYSGKLYCVCHGQKEKMNFSFLNFIADGDDEDEEVSDLIIKSGVKDGSQQDDHDTDVKAKSIFDDYEPFLTENYEQSIFSSELTSSPGKARTTDGIPRQEKNESSLEELWEETSSKDDTSANNVNLPKEEELLSVGPNPNPNPADVPVVEELSGTPKRKNSSMDNKILEKELDPLVPKLDDLVIMESLTTESIQSKNEVSPRSSFTLEPYDHQKAIEDFLSDDCLYKTKNTNDEIEMKEIKPKTREKSVQKKNGMHKDTYQQPNLYDDCREMVEFCSIIYVLSKIRNLARDGKLTQELKLKIEKIIPSNDEDDVIKIDTTMKEFFRTPAECVLQKSVKIKDIYDAVNKCYDIVKEDDCHTDLHIDMMRRMMDRADDADSYEVDVFDDSREDKESVAGIIIDHHRKQLVVAFRATMVGNMHDFRSNFSMFQAWVSNPLLKMKHCHTSMKCAGQKQQLMLQKQPETILMQYGWYNAIMSDRSRLGAGSKYDFIMKSILRLLNKYPGYSLCVTGTSLGAALAQVFAFHAATETKLLLNKPLRCYSFASPKVGTLRYRRAVETLEELGKLQLLRILNEEDYIRFIPRELTTMCCFTGLTTLSLIFNQGLFYRKAGIELNLTDAGIAFTHPKVRVKHAFDCDSTTCYFYICYYILQLLANTKVDQFSLSRYPHAK